MSLEEKIGKDYVQAMKDRNSLRSSTLSFLRAQIKNVRIEKKADKVEDAEVIAVIKKQVKQRQESIEQYKNGGRQDLADKEAAELVILREYLPQEMTEDKVKAIVAETIKELGAQSIKDMGKVMKATLDKVQGQADSKVVSEVVKNSLSQI